MSGVTAFDDGYGRVHERTVESSQLRPLRSCEGASCLNFVGALSFMYLDASVKGGDRRQQLGWAGLVNYDRVEDVVDAPRPRIYRDSTAMPDDSGPLVPGGMCDIVACQGGETDATTNCMTAGVDACDKCRGCTKQDVVTHSPIYGACYGKALFDYASTEANSVTNADQCTNAPVVGSMEITIQDLKPGRQLTETSHWSEAELAQAQASSSGVPEGWAGHAGLSNVDNPYRPQINADQAAVFGLSSDQHTHTLDSVA